jgi:hypothetical protein
MAIEMIGCNRCGWVARPDLFEGSHDECPQCTARLQAMSISQARGLVVARRRADRRRSEAQRAAEMGLDDVIA